MKKKPYTKKREYHNKEHEEERKASSDEGVDSDGFDIVGVEKKKTTEYKPKKRYENNGERKNWVNKDNKDFNKNNRGAKDGAKYFNKGGKDKKKENVMQEGGEFKPQEEIVKKAPEKEGIVITINSSTKKLSDLFA